MPILQHSIRPRARRRLTICVVVSMAVLLVATPLAGGASGSKKRPGATGKLKFSLNKHDKAALRASRKAEKLRAQATAQREAASSLDHRVQALEQILAAAEEEEATVRATLEARLVERYKDGDDSQIAELLGGTSISMTLQQLDLAQEIRDRDERLADQHELALMRVIEAQAALREQRDQHGQLAADYETQAAQLDSVVVDAKYMHQTSSLAREGEVSEGMWVMTDDPNSMFGLQGFPGLNSGQAWGGGTRTPARKATPTQIAAVLSDPRIDIYAGGRMDVASGQIDGRILDAIRALAFKFGSVRITSLKSGHSVLTSSGNVSAHSYGCAADIGSVGGVLITPAAQGPGGITEQAVRFLASFTGDLAPHQVISLLALGGPTMSMGDHGDHIHLGYSC